MRTPPQPVGALRRTVEKSPYDNSLLPTEQMLPSQSHMSVASNGGDSMSRIFLSHSSANNAHAIALRDWLIAEGWADLFLDLDPNHGVAAGERWERALNEAARRCEAVLFLISREWLASLWCMSELKLARRLNKRLFGVIVEEGLSLRDLPTDVSSEWQLVNLAAGRDHKQFRVTLPITGEETTSLFRSKRLGVCGMAFGVLVFTRATSAGRPRTTQSGNPIAGFVPLKLTTLAFFLVARHH